MIDVVVEQEGGDTCLTLAIDEGPVDGSGSPILGQQRGMKVEGAQGWHGPYAFGQHAEGNDDKEVGTPSTQGVLELRVAQTLGLEQGELMLEGVLFDGRLGDLEAATGRAVGHGDYADYAMPRLADGLERGNGKIGGTHEDNVHIEIIVNKNLKVIYRTRMRVPDLGLLRSGFSSRSLSTVV